MKLYIPLIMSVALVVPGSVFAANAGDSPVCTDVNDLMYTDKPKCEKGDVIMVNPMMAAFLCDMSMPNISGDKLVICHYLGKKRAERKGK